MTDQPHVRRDDGLTEGPNRSRSSSTWLHPYGQAAVLSGSTGAVSTARGGARPTGSGLDHGLVAEPSSGAGTVSTDWPLISTLELAALPTAVACGRLHAKQLLWEWKLDVLADDAETLVSELLTNAVKASRSLHEASFVTLRLLANRHQLVIEVWDQHPDDPQPHVADIDAEHGRGFMVIDALARRWGYHRVSANLKVVWCELVVEQP